VTDTATSLIDLAQRSGGAGVVLADPPWHFKVRSLKGEGRSACQHYSVPTFDELAALPVNKIASPDCWLFLWCTGPHLPHGLRLMESWGFAYSGVGFTWVKLNPSGVGFHVGLGFTTRKNTEVCLLGRRGKPGRNAKDVRELIVAPRREHSRKPDQQYERIERFCDGPYVELFARTSRAGWVCWGDQTSRFTGAYDPLVDIQESVAEGFRVIRKRKVAGGRGWGE
jgi:N6-adenosine-specific RNA methylase IME4